jgi:hypothetical protein
VVAVAVLHLQAMQLVEAVLVVIGHPLGHLVAVHLPNQN